MDMESYEINGRWRFEWLLPTLIQPRRTFKKITAAETAVWQTPILVLLATGLLRVLVESSLAATTSQAMLPPGSEFYSPEQQMQMQQAMNATNGPIFVYVLPAVMTLLGVYLGWLILGWVLHLGLTLVGGRGSSQQALNLVAWSLLPFAIRDVVRVAAMWLTGQPVTALGISGFAPVDESNLAIYLTALLSFVDIYLFWHIGLLLVGVRTAENLSRVKAWGIVLLVVVSLLLLKAIPALIAAQFSGLTVMGPLF